MVLSHEITPDPIEPRHCILDFGQVILKGCAKELAFLRTDFKIDRRQLGIYLIWSLLAVTETHTRYLNLARPSTDYRI
jgi:hypothetical protein